MALWTRKERPAPCPSCDAPLDPSLAKEARPTCPACGQSLAPVHVAGFWRRLGAALVDTAILLITAGPLHLGLQHLLGSPSPVRGGFSWAGLLQLLTVDPLDVLVWLAPLLIMAAIYFVVFIALSGRTPGQKLVGIRVVDRAGGKVGPVRATVRLAGTAVGLVPGGLGSLWMAFDREKRAFHDYLTGTYVVREQ
ncbi:MAG TPA: RDD family protein [Nannocystis sp.]